MFEGLDLEDRIISTLQCNLQKNIKVRLESRLVEDLMVDSFDMLMLISALEDEFAVNIDEADFSDIITVGDIVEKFKSAYHS